MSGDHLIAMSAGWRTWRWIALRSAGFAAAGALRFAATGTCRAIDRLLELERVADAARADAIGACQRALDAGGDRKPLRKVLQRLRGGQVPAGDALDVDLAALRAAAAAVAEQQQLVAAELASDSLQIDAAVRELARDPRFREALAWQNRAVITTLLEPLLASPPGAGDAAARRRQAIIAGYAQRYCVKNDTIGFFGPVGWARIGDGDQVATITPGPTLLDARNVHYEYWCIDALATQLSEDPELRRELSPRLMPAVRLDGTIVHYPIARSREIPYEYAVVLGACDGMTPASAIVETLAADPELGLGGDEIFEMLGALADQRLIRWALDVPTAGQYPERHLHAALARLPSSDARDRAVAALAELEAGRAAVAAAAGDPAAVDRALAAFADHFTSATGVAATRRAGETYAGRTLLYEDTRRAVDVEFGSRFVTAFADPLALLMLAARWYTHTIATGYLAILHATYRELRERTGEARVDFVQFLDQVIPHFATQHEVAPVVRDTVTRLQAQWVEILGVTTEPRQIALSSAALRARVEAAFAAPAPGWPQARYQSPDVMIAAAGPDALASGRYVGVLGEIHTGTQTHTSVFVNLHREPEAIIRGRRVDLQRPLIATVEPRAGALRADHVNFAPDDLDLEVGDAKSWRAREHVLAAGELVVEDIDGRLHACTRDGRARFDLVAVLEGHFVLASTTHFQLLPRLVHTPRITIDNLVIARESWSFEPAELAFAGAAGVDRLVGARRWAQRHGLPRCIFVRVPHEPKPCFIDLESPVYLESLARLVRKATTVAVSEMLPSIDETWLVDAEGQTYCAELRITMVDPEPWRPG